MSIFPSSHKDADALIISFLPNNSVGVLTRLNHSTLKAAFEILSETFCKNRFHQQHPHLSKYNVFQTLQLNHPTNCWKIACFGFSKMPGNIPEGICEEAPPFFCFLLRSEKERLQLEMQQISKDPNSSLMQALKSSREGFQRWRSLQCQKNRLFEQLKEDPMQNLPLVLLFVSVIEKCNSAFVDGVNLEKIYNTILYKYKFSINQLDSKINSLIFLSDQEELLMKQDSPFYYYSKNLSIEYSMAVKLEIAHELQPILEECIHLITGIRKKEIEPTAVNLDRIKELIDSYTASRGKVNIWQRLYLQCAQFSTETNWSQKHFHEFLPHLLSIVCDANQIHALVLLDAQSIQYKNN